MPRHVVRWEASESVTHRSGKVLPRLVRKRQYDRRANEVRFEFHASKPIAFVGGLCRQICIHAHHSIQLRSADLELLQDLAYLASHPSAVLSGDGIVSADDRVNALRAQVVFGLAAHDSRISMPRSAFISFFLSRYIGVIIPLESSTTSNHSPCPYSR